MLDARVAHNIVKDNLPLYVEEPQTLITRAFNFTFDHVNALRRRGDLTSRNLRRMVERRVLPTLNARGYGACYVPVYLRIGGGCLYRERRERIFELHRKERGTQRT